MVTRTRHSREPERRRRIGGGDTELTKFRPFRNFVSEGKPDRASADQAVTPMKFRRV